MAQLLVREVDEALVRKLKLRAAAEGVSAEEEHRRILKAALNRPLKRRDTLIEFLLSEDGTVLPEVELDLERSRRIENRDAGL